MIKFLKAAKAVIFGAFVVCVATSKTVHNAIKKAVDYIVDRATDRAVDRLIDKVDSISGAYDMKTGDCKLNVTLK